MRQGDLSPYWKKRLRRKPVKPKGEPVLKILKRLNQSQWWPEKKMRRAQFEAVSEFLLHTKDTVLPYTGILMLTPDLSPEALMEGAWLDIPIMTRDVVNGLGDKLMSQKIPESHGNLDPIYTSGTTGRPVRVVRTSRALQYWSAFVLLDHAWHDRDLSLTLAAIRSSSKDFALYPGGARHDSWGASDRVFKSGRSLSLNVNTQIADVADWIGRTKPEYLLSLPNVIRRLAPYCIEAGIKFPFLKEIQVHGEVVTDYLREICREAWGVPIYDVYTSREVGYMALQCPVHEHYHVMSEGVVLEVLKDDNTPCSPGETGRVIVTTYRNYAMPLIRYEVGDYAEVGEPCECGRGLPVLKRIIGRQQDSLVLPTGEQRWTLLGSPDIKTFMEMAPIKQYQFAHTAPDRMEVRLAVHRALTGEEEKDITAWLQKKLGYPFKMAFVYADELPRTKAGKFKDFVKEF